MQRREMIKRAGLGITGLALVGGETSCAPPKNLSLYVETVVGALREVRDFLPGSAGLIAKAIEIASDFKKAYDAGHFADATTLFTNLAGLLSQIVSDAGVNSPMIKIALAVAGIAMRAIAVLLKSQSEQPVVAQAMKKQSTSAASRAQITLIERLASSAAVDTAFAAAKL